MRRESARHQSRLWRLVETQHGLVTRRQLLDAGFTSDEIDGRVRIGRLHRLWRGVFAVGRPRLTLRGWWSAAVLACGPHAVLSHHSAAELWGIREPRTSNDGEQNQPALIEVSVPASKSHRRRGIRTHRRRDFREQDRIDRDGIPVTSPVRTLLDLARLLDPGELEAAINNADKLDRIDPESLRIRLNEYGGAIGAPALRRVLDQRTSPSPILSSSSASWASFGELACRGRRPSGN
jgi:hypothetical protein